MASFLNRIFLMADSDNQRASSSYRKKFLVRKIHKLKKILKLTASRKFYHDEDYKSDSLEAKQNLENERLMDLMKDEMFTNRQNERNNNYENDDNDDDYDKVRLEENFYDWENARNENRENSTESGCCPCAVAGNFWWDYYRHEQRSICFVFMPNEPVPVPVKLRSTKIPGGYTWVSYGFPDADIYANNDVGTDRRTITGSQTAQQQRAGSVCV